MFWIEQGSDLLNGHLLSEKTEDTMKTKKTEERRGKHAETMMFEDKKRQCLNICTPNQ